MLGILSAIGLDHRQFGLHSLHAGGASADCSRDMAGGVMRMPRICYVKDKMEDRLEVSHRIGL